MADVTYKTPDRTTSPTFKQVLKTNVLNKYRSFNYKFTLAGLKSTAVNDPESYRGSSLDLVIIESGGKGTDGVAVPGDLSSKKIAANNRYQKESISMSATVESIAAAKKELDAVSSFNPGLVKGFNEKSSGKFDFFIDSVDIDCLMGFSEQTSTSMFTGLRFEVYEPYSINGFVEALQAVAVAAGYPSYAQASFLLKVEFIGYPDGEEMSSAEVVDKSSRYFVFGFSGLAVDVSEKGTRYRCAAVPFNEKGYGQPNKLKETVQMSGNTVQTILKDLMNKVTEQVAKANKDSKETSDSKKHDIYDIEFPVWVEGKGFTSSSGQVNEIGSAEVNQLLRDNIVYKFPDPGTNTKADAYKGSTGAKQQSSTNKKINTETGDEYTPLGAPVAQFAEGANINECISSLIRDSKYIRNILATLGETGNPDENGMINYFLVRLKVENLDSIDTESRKPFQKFIYVVTPHKIHITRVPSFATQKFPQSQILPLSMREYNYTYTGENIDVLNFKLNFNTLFFESIPRALGNNDSPDSRFGAGEGGAVIIKSKGDDIANLQKDRNPSSTKQVSTQPSQVQQAGGNAGQTQGDPYAVLAKNLHQSVINSHVNLVKADLEILGDPFYLVTGGIGNYEPKPASRGITIDGEADHNYGEVLITVNFRNPVDINPLSKGGRLYFDDNKVPFSGVYRVNKVYSSFRDGTFKQKLEILRIPGQIVDMDVKPTNPADVYEDFPDPLDSYVPDTGIGSAPSQRPSDVNLLLQKARGLPSPGLPGALSAFTGAAGLLGGANNLLSQVSGAVTNGIGKLTSGAAIFGGSVPNGTDQLSSGIRLSGSGLNPEYSSSPALLTSLEKSIQNAFPITNVAKNLASGITKSVTAAKNLISVQGSGIGSGATISIDPPTSSSGSDTPKVATDLISQTAALPTDVTSVAGIARDLNTNALAALTSIGSNAESFVSGVGGKLKSLTNGTATDPTAIASKFGINASQLSGLSPDLQSKVLAEVSNLAKQVPSDVDIASARENGVILSNIPAGKLANLPATTPFATAPSPEIDKPFLENLVKTGGTSALARAFGVDDVSKVTAGLLPSTTVKDLLTSANSKLTNPLAGLTTELNKVDVTALGSKLLSASSQLSSLVGASSSVESSLNSAKSIVGSALNTGSDLENSVTSKFGSLSSGTSPLDKLMIGSEKRTIT